MILDLFNREIVGYAASKHKDSKHVYQAIASIQSNLNNFEIFHTDRGSEFKNSLISDALKQFNIAHSLSAKGTPYDNAVAEAQFKVIKTEFVKNQRFESINELQVELRAYVRWFNTKRIHGSLGYKTPIEFKLSVR